MREPRRFLCVALGLLRLRRLAAQPRLCVRQLLLLLGHLLPRLLHLRLFVRRFLLGVRCALQGLLCLILLRACLGFLALLAAPEHRAPERERDAHHPDLVPHREASCVLPLPEQDANGKPIGHPPQGPSWTLRLRSRALQRAAAGAASVQPAAGCASPRWRRSPAADSARPAADGCPLPSLRRGCRSARRRAGAVASASGHAPAPPAAARRPTARRACDRADARALRSPASPSLAPPLALAASG